MTGSAPPAPEVDSDRVAAARERAEQRLRRQRDALRPLGWAVLALVLAGSAGGRPTPALHGRGLAVTIALVAFAAALLVAIRTGFSRRPPLVQATVVAAIGAAGVALAGLQPRNATELAAGAATFMAVARLAPVAGIALAGAVTIGLALTTALAGSSPAAVLAGTLLLILLAVVAHFLRRARLSQERTELLLARLEDAQAEQARAATIAERGRIAGELHDVLAHSLSGAAIQLQGARLLAEREQATPAVREAIDRASELVRDGLGNARQAVGALRGDQLPGLAQLDELVRGFRSDLRVDATLRVEGTPRPLPADAGLALYRAAQEALTNVARYAPAAATTVVLRYEDGRTALSVENGSPCTETDTGALAGVGGGRGLDGMRERLERTGGRMQAGPTKARGWRVDLEVPV